MITGTGDDTESALRDFVDQATDGAHRLLTYKREDDTQPATGEGNYIVRGRAKDDRQIEVFRVHVEPQIDGFTATDEEIPTSR